MKSSNPEIRIQYSPVLDLFFQQLFKYKQEEDPDLAGVVYDSPEIISEKIKEFEKVWESKKDVLEYMQQILGLNFYQTLIDVYVVGFSQPTAISTPVIISSQNIPEVFVKILIHEILHRLISDNTQKISAGKILGELYSKETVLCRNHIVLHAVLEKIYLEFFKDPQALSKTVEKNKAFPDYARAWEIVEQQGADEIINNFKNLYGKQKRMVASSL